MCSDATRDGSRRVLCNVIINLFKSYTCFSRHTIADYWTRWQRAPGSLQAWLHSARARVRSAYAWIRLAVVCGSRCVTFARACRWRALFVFVLKHCNVLKIKNTMSASLIYQTLYFTTTLLSNYS